MTAPRRSSDRLSWFKFDAGAFIADTNGLPAAHVGILARLLSLYWTGGGSLPDNPAILKRKLGVTTSDDEQALQEVLAEFFPEGRHAQLETQLEEVRENSRAQSERAKVRHHGKASAEPKKDAQAATQASSASQDDTEDF
jgi:uncharacterized protein YdaU (DUF1376 family)